MSDQIKVSVSISPVDGVPFIKANREHTITGKGDSQTALIAAAEDVSRTLDEVKSEVLVQLTDVLHAVSEE